MDEIQKVLIKAGRKDLAQKYYLKISKKEISEDIGKRNLALTLGYTNLGGLLKDLKQKASKGAEDYSFMFSLPPGFGNEGISELEAWSKPSYFKQIKLPMPKLKEYVKSTWKDIYSFMEKNKLW